MTLTECNISMCSSTEARQGGARCVLGAYRFEKEISDPKPLVRLGALSLLVVFKIFLDSSSSFQIVAVDLVSVYIQGVKEDRRAHGAHRVLILEVLP